MRSIVLIRAEGGRLARKQEILKLYGFKGVIDAREGMDGGKYGLG